MIRRSVPIAGIFALCASCGGGVAASDSQLASGVGDAMASLDETAGGSSSARLDLPVHSLPPALAPGIGPRLMDVLFPKAYADSCWLAGFSICAAGIETRTLSACSVGTLTLSGMVTLTWSDPACILAASGDSVTRTGEFTMSNFEGATLTISSNGGGQELIDNGTSYSYKVLGIDRVAATASGTKLFDISTSTSADIGVSGISRATRVATGGTLVIQHNILHYGVELAPDNLAWSADCNCPVSGSLSGKLTGSASGSYTLDLTGCGSANVTTGGKSESIQLDRCGDI